MAEVKLRVASMEASLEKLNQGEGKYTAELDEALSQYAVLLQQAEGLNQTELYEARQVLRTSKEQEVIQRIQDTYGKQIDISALRSSIQNVSDILHEDSKTQSIHYMLSQLRQRDQQSRQHQNQPKNQER